MSDNLNSTTAENTVQALWKVTKVVLDTLDFNEVTQRICDSLLGELGYLNLGYRVIVLSLFDESRQGLHRTAISQTAEARAAMDASTIPFHNILIPSEASENICVKAFKEQKHYVTHDWKDILSPPLTPEAARANQQAAGVKTSMVFPVVLKNKAVGVVIFSMVKSEEEVSKPEFDLIRGFTEIVGIAVQNARLYSDLEQTSRNLDEANKKLEILDKLKDEFVSVTSHELRTPMTAIKSYTWMVLNEKAGPIEPKVRDYLGKVYESTERLLHLVNEMLDISRIEGGRVQLNMAPVQLVDLAHKVESDFHARAIEQQLSLLIESEANVPAVNVDEEKIHQVLENLVGNAFKFTSPGGKVTMHISQVGDTVQVDVVDTGKGIKAEDIGKLFTKFGRIEGSLMVASGNSTGLGLYISKQYVEMHKGKIWIISKVDQGTTVSFSFPLT